MEQTTLIDTRLQDRQNNCIAQGALTNSKHPRSYIRNVYPTHLERGFKAYVYDDKGKEYIDFINGLGTNLFGYANSQIENTMMASIMGGINLSLPTCKEVEAAEAILSILPWYNRVKFLKTGSSACSAAVRIARNATGRNKILSTGYHGWHDPFVSIYQDAKGVDKCDVRYMSSITEIDNMTAAVIIEPVMLDYSEKQKKYLQTLEETCRQTGTLVIYDETITALRVPGLSITKQWNLRPDLVVMGKALAAGLPLACVVGNKEIMDDPKYFVSGTYFGEMLSLSVCKKVVTMLKTKALDIKDLWEFGEDFKEFFNKTLEHIVQIEGYNTRYALKGNTRLRAVFMQEACKAGMLFGLSPFLNFEMILLRDRIKDKLLDVAGIINSGKVRLIGYAPHSPFSSKLREM